MIDWILSMAKEWWPQIVFTLSTGIAVGKWVGRAMKKTAAAAENDRIAAQIKADAMMAGLLEMLRFRLYRECHKCIDIGAKSEDKLEVIEGLHAAYNALGGNHTGDRLYKEAVELPTVSEAVFETMYRQRHCLHGRD